MTCEVAARPEDAGRDRALRDACDERRDDVEGKAPLRRRPTSGISGERSESAACRGWAAWLRCKGLPETATTVKEPWFFGAAMRSWCSKGRCG